MLPAEAIHLPIFESPVLSKTILTFALLLCAFEAFAGEVLGPAENLQLTQIVDANLKALDGLTSLQFETESTGYWTETAIKVLNIPRIYTAGATKVNLRATRKFWYFNTTSTNSEGVEYVNRTHSFNGTNYAFLESMSGHLTLTKKAILNTQFLSQGAIFYKPFNFLSNTEAKDLAGGPEFVLADLTSRENWTRFRQNVLTLEKVEKAGHPCVKVTVRGGRDYTTKRNFYWIVYFAEDCNWYPIAVEKIGTDTHKIMSSYEVVEVGKCVADKVTVLYPKKAETKDFNLIPTGELAAEGALSITDIKINHLSDDDINLFSIDPMLAKTVTDQDDLSRRLQPWPGR